MARLVDTSVFIDFERRGISVTEFMATAPDVPTLMARITAAELLVGIERAAPGARRRQRAAFIEGVLMEVSVVPFDLAVARVHARVLAQLRTAGQVIGTNDLPITATALTYG
jgi:predicted nucleic acid-binding protein